MSARIRFASFSQPVIRNLWTSLSAISNTKPICLRKPQMMYLNEYQKRPEILADYLPWSALIAPGVILNKDGSFQRTAQFRGPDLESSTEEELVATCARINNALKRFSSGWALYFEASRIPARDYPCLLYTSPSPRDKRQSRMPSSA